MFLVAGVLWNAALAVSVANADEMPRRVSLGLQVGPVTQEARLQSKLKNSRGVQVISALPNSASQEANLQAGDVVLKLSDKAVRDVQQFMEYVSTLREGKELALVLNRNGEEHLVTVRPKPLPLETSNDFDIEYANIVSTAGRMRTVLTRPHTEEKLPAVLLLAGLALGPAEHPVADPIGLKSLAYALTKRGFAVLRVDRPGCGDSEGGPAQDADLHQILDGYLQGARALKKHPAVDPNQVYLLGASIGGVQAPLVAAQEPVRGIAICGAMPGNWADFIRDTTRRQSFLAGAKAGEIETAVREESGGWHYLLYEGLSPDEIAEHRPELTNWVERNWVDGKYFSGIHYRFFQQLGEAKVAEAWEQVDASVLSLWGERDVVTSRQDHEFVAEIANRKRAGSGIHRVLSGVDHQLQVLPAPNQPASNQGVELLADTFAEWTKQLEAAAS